ncbi:hypothetical protein [Shimia biformata]|uniref:hypothetical protein n=1 Tax=Shimia biformata TaxID=1294299 RepID=UPI0019517CD3|nr:hypothetical protein [Shimia biformata]
MSEISELENRLSKAMARIAAGIDALPGAASEAEASADADEMAALKQALEDEKTASAQLEERVKALGDKADALANDLKAETARADAAEAHAAKLADDAEAAAEAAAAAAAEAASVPPAPAGAGIDFDEGRELLNQLSRRLRRLRGFLAELKANNKQMRAALEANLADPALVDQSLRAELEEMTTMRAIEQAEAEAILAVLRPMLGDDLPEVASGGANDNKEMGDG